MVELLKTPQTLEEYVDALTDLKFGSYGPGVALPPSWKRGRGGYSAMPVQAKQYQDELRRLSIETPQQKYKQIMDALIEAISRKNEAEEASAFCNQPNAKADFDHWSKMAYWTLEEGGALLLGREPKRVNSQTLKDFGRDLPLKFHPAPIRASAFDMPCWAG